VLAAQVGGGLGADGGGAAGFYFWFLSVTIAWWRTPCWIAAVCSAEDARHAGVL